MMLLSEDTELLRITLSYHGGEVVGKILKESGMRLYPEEVYGFGK